MQSLSVSNLQVLEIDESYSKYLGSSDNKIISKKINFGNFKRKLPRNDSGYTSSAETVFSIDNNNYVSFRGNKNFKRDSSSQSLYDKSLLDVNEVFGINFQKIYDFDVRSLDRKSYYRNSDNKSIQSLPCFGSKAEDFQTKFESRSWEDIYKLSDLVLKNWENNGKKILVNSSLQKSYEYFQPNLSAKSSLLLNDSLLLQPLRRYTSEINLHKIHINQEIFRDDFQIDSNFYCEDFIRNKNEVNDNKSLFKNISEEVLQLVLDLHEFRINDENINKISDKISEIDKFLISNVKRTDIANNLFSRNVCGCKLSSICSVISFSQALSQIVNDVIDSKTTAYERIDYIIAFIKIAMSLYQKANWQSLNTLINSLHSFTVYRMNNEWFQIKEQNKHYFDEFVKLSTIIRSSETSILRTIQKGIPDIRNILITQKLNCCTKLDRLENPAKWLENPGIINWLENQLKNSIRDKNNEENMHFDSNYDKQTNKKNFICLIQLSQLPQNWTKRSLKNMPLEYRKEVVQHLYNCLDKELKFD